MKKISLDFKKSHWEKKVKRKKSHWTSGGFKLKMQLLMSNGVSKLFNPANRIPHNSTNLHNRCCVTNQGLH